VIWIEDEHATSKDVVDDANKKFYEILNELIDHMKLMNLQMLEKTLQRLYNYVVIDLQKQIEFLKKIKGYPKESYRDHRIQKRLFADKIEEL